jgi:hypothetical protein
VRRENLRQRFDFFQMQCLPYKATSEQLVTKSRSCSNGIFTRQGKLFRLLFKLERLLFIGGLANEHTLLKWKHLVLSQLESASCTAPDNAIRRTQPFEKGSSCFPELPYRFHLSALLISYSTNLCLMRIGYTLISFFTYVPEFPSLLNKSSTGT